MKPYHQYWTFSAIRGALALVAALFIFIVPFGASQMCHMPPPVGLSINCLAAFSVFDGAVLILLTLLLPARATHRKMLYGQSALSITVGLTLFLIAARILSGANLLEVLSAQAALAAIVECSLARDTHQEYGCLSCYSTAMVLLAVSIAMPFAHGLDASSMTMVLSGFAAAYGVSELTLAGRMLFLEFRSEHPAAVPSSAWLSAMSAPTLLASASRYFHKLCEDCSSCPADALCHDNSVKGQIAGIMADRSPAIIRATRIQSLLERKPVGV